jgi:hypothetical protein
MKLRYAGIFLVILHLVNTALAYPDEYSKNVEVINNTSYTLLFFYTSSADAIDWEQEILVRGRLEPGQEIVVNIEDGTTHCIYDLKAVFRGVDKPVYRYHVDVCRIASWTINDSKQ